MEVWEKYRDRNKSRAPQADRPGADRPRQNHVQRRKGSAEELRRALRSIDHRSYPAYKDLQGSYDFRTYVLGIDHVQGDPFAAPSSVSVHIDGQTALFPENSWKKPDNRRAFQDYLIRVFHREIEQYSRKVRGSGKSGLIFCSTPGQEILERSACQIDPKSGDLIFRLYVGFPAAGRTVLASELETILFDYLPEAVTKSLLYRSLPAGQIQAVTDLAEDQTALRALLPDMDLAAFVADGAILPRESGISQRPMKGAVPFRSPDEDRVEVTLPHRGRLTGMGIRRGITLIIGGGYHGKSTLLQALERGVYDHIAGDGRELVITDPTAMKIRAEDGRSIQCDDISPFIRNLPNGKDTRCFSTEDASGSTSQAACVVEAIESGSRVLLMDEDTCATNFMVRDELMQRVVAADEEPIKPYSQTMRPLFEKYGASTILVAGSSGAFFPVADTIIQMDRYMPRDVTKKVRAVLAKESLPETDGSEESLSDWDFSVRRPKAGNAFFAKDGRIKHKSLGVDGFSIDHDTVDLRGVEQIVDSEQTECLARLLIAASRDMTGSASVRRLVEARMAQIARQGMAGVSGPDIPGNLALPRPQELFAAINRCRSIRF